jgi:aminoglycoside phosphotransferase (APT) family kinase protein
LSPAQVEQVLALNERQRDLAPAEMPRWPARIVNDALNGGDGYCLLDAMRQHGPDTARLLALVQEIAARYRDVATPTTDIVHFDFQPANILAQPDRITGVVDWDGVRGGDRAFDLATLLFYVYDQKAPREALWQRLLSIAEPAAIVLYLGHLIHRQVDWSIRHHDDATVDGWLERARVVLADLPARTGLAVPPWP